MIDQKRVIEFEKEHGDSEEYNGLMFYADGATRHAHPEGQLTGLPEDVSKRIKNQITYAKLKYNFLVRKFNDKKYDAMQTAQTMLKKTGNPGGPPADAKVLTEELLKIKELCEQWLTNIAKLSRELKLCKPPKQSLAEATEQMNRANLANFISTVAEVEIDVDEFEDEFGDANQQKQIVDPLTAKFLQVTGLDEVYK